MTCATPKLVPLLECLVERIADKLKEALTPHEELVRNSFVFVSFNLQCLEVSQLYPKDVGLLGLFLMNYFTLQPGDAIFLAPNEPHAYLSVSEYPCFPFSLILREIASNVWPIQIMLFARASLQNLWSVIFIFFVFPVPCHYFLNF